MSKRSLLTWLEQQIEEGTVPELVWLDKSNKEFAMPWKRNGKGSGPDDSKLFRLYAEYTQKKEGRSPASWKQNFRTALRSVETKSRGIEEDKSRREKDRRVFRFTPERQRRQSVQSDVSYPASPASAVTEACPESPGSPAASLTSWHGDSAPSPPVYTGRSLDDTPDPRLPDFAGLGLLSGGDNTPARCPELSEAVPGDTITGTGADLHLLEEMDTGDLPYFEGGFDAAFRDLDVSFVLKEDLPLLPPASPASDEESVSPFSFELGSQERRDLDLNQIEDLQFSQSGAFPEN